MSGRQPVGMQEWMRQQEKRARQAEISRPMREVIDPFPYALGWGRYSTSWMAPKITKLYGEVRLEGMLGRTGSTISSTLLPQAIGTLPIGFRPREDFIAYAYAEAGGGATGMMRFDIPATGQILMRWLSSAPYTQNVFVVPLDTIIFRTSVG